MRGLNQPGSIAALHLRRIQSNIYGFWRKRSTLTSPVDRFTMPVTAFFRRTSLHIIGAFTNSNDPSKFNESGSSALVMLPAVKCISTSRPVDVNTIGRNDLFVELQIHPLGNRIDSCQGRSKMSILALLLPKQYDRPVSGSTRESHVRLPVIARLISTRIRSPRCASNRYTQLKRNKSPLDSHQTQNPVLVRQLTANASLHLSRREIHSAHFAPNAVPSSPSDC